MRSLGALIGKIFILLIFAFNASTTQGLSAENQMENEEAKQQKELKAFPKVQFDELSHDFGKVFQNSTLKHTFTFKNVGTGILHVKKPKAG